MIYTFWAKHGPCQAKGCGHRTPIFRTPVIAEKKLSTSYAELTCPECGTQFHAELGGTRMAPGSERVILEDEIPFTELTQDLAQLLKDYDKGNANDTLERTLALKDSAPDEQGFHCPDCGTFAGKRLLDVLDRHARANRAAQRKKKDLGLKSKPVQMFLLIHPEWLKGSSGFDGAEELGGWAGANAGASAAWFEQRIAGLSLVEVRGKTLPDIVVLSDGTVIETNKATVPKQAHFTCGNCGKSQKRLDATKKVEHSAPVAPYALQCHCPQCEAEGYFYGGRYFKLPSSEDILRIGAADREWESRKETDLSVYWPRMEIAYSMRTHVKDPLPDHGYTHWWMLFSNRQLLVHATLLRATTEAPEDAWTLDVREQAAGVFQQYLRNQNTFCFWDIGYDKLVPFMSNPNYNPKNLKNFKAFQDAELKDLPNFCVFVGANGSGKSTIFSMFGFLRDAMTSNVNTALARLGGSRGFREVRSRNSKGPIEIELKFREKDTSPLTTYLLQINEEKGKAYVAREVLRYRRGSSGQPWQFLNFSRGKGTAVTNELESVKDVKDLQREEQTGW